jgi:hypothetical protein
MTAGRTIVFLLLAAVLLATPGMLAAQDDRPRGGLFSEQGPSGQPLSLGWFALGLYVLVGLIFAGAAAHLAVQKARPPVAWFLVGFLLNAVGYLILLTRPPGAEKEPPAAIPHGLHKMPLTCDHRRCPACGAYNHPAASYCPTCGAQMQPGIQSEAARWREQRQPH